MTATRGLACSGGRRATSQPTSQHADMRVLTSAVADVAVWLRGCVAACVAYNQGGIAASNLVEDLDLFRVLSPWSAWDASGKQVRKNATRRSVGGSFRRAPLQHVAPQVW